MRITTIYVVACVSNLYDYAKKNSGPLRSTVGSVEGVVSSVVGPVYEKFKGVPSDLLVFVDNKVILCALSLCFSSSFLCGSLELV